CHYAAGLCRALPVRDRGGHHPAARGCAQGGCLLRRTGADMKKLAWPLAAIWLVCAQAAVADQFSKVQCGGDIPKALIGQIGKNERIVVLEGRNKKLGLKHL